MEKLSDFIAGAADVHLDSRVDPTKASEVAADCPSVLNNDIWYLVFTELVLEHEEDCKTEELNATTQDEFTTWLRHCRLISKTFNDAITPLSYKSIALTDSRSSKAPEGFEGPRERYLINRGKYTQHVKILHSKICHPDADTRPFISDCAALKSITYYKERDSNFGYLRGYTIPELGEHWLQAFSLSRSVPTQCSMIFNCHFFQLTMMDTTKASSLPRSIENAPNYTLDRLYIYHGNDWFADSMSPFNGKPLRMKKLKIKGPGCEYTKGSLSSLWDFSELENLHLITMEAAPLLDFKTIPLDQYSQIRSLTLQNPCFCLAEEYTTIKDGLRALFSTLKHLDVLKVVSLDWIDFVPLTELGSLGNTLRKLRLVGRDYGTVYASVDDLQSFLLSSPKLETLEIDFCPVSEEARSTLNLLTRIGNLKHLRLRLGLDYPPDSDFRHLKYPDQRLVDGTDIIYEAVETLMTHIHSLKHNEPFESLTILTATRFTPQRRNPNPYFPVRVECVSNRGPSNFNRSFISRINDSGTYEQWGSQREMD